jgi:hypothetical protein
MASVTFLVLMLGGGCSSDQRSGAPASASASTALCPHQFETVATPAMTTRLDHEVDLSPYTLLAPGDVTPAIDATKALQLAQQRQPLILGNPVTATLASATRDEETRLVWLLTVEDVPIQPKGPSPETCLSQTAIVDATSGDVLGVQIGPPPFG